MLDSIELAKHLNCELTDDMPTPKRHIESYDVLKTVSYLARKYKKNVILFGGHIATPSFFGFKNMRSLTNDIDFILKEDIAETVIMNESLIFHTPYRVFFTYINTVLCVFNISLIHDWKIPQNFYEDCYDFNIDGTNVTVTAPEYIIALKLRRGFFNNMALFGKDALDIINLLGGQLVKNNNRRVNYSKVAQITLTSTGKDVIQLFKAIREHIVQVPHELRNMIFYEIEKLYEYFIEELK